MPDLLDGETAEVKGSARLPYILKNVGGVYSCTCPAWRNQSIAIEQRTCKHLKAYRGEAAETQRVGQTTTAAARTAAAKPESGPELLLAQPWENDVDLAGWWISEKLDGVRAYWDGKQFLSRQGNRFHAPDWFVASFPAQPLDGELWLARKAFQRTVSIVRRQDKSDHWREIRYLVFDAPSVDAPFEERLEHVRDLIQTRRPEFAQAHQHLRCTGLSHLREELARVEALGGEGLMLRQPGSRYERGRSSTLLKVKTFLDAEARVVEHLAGTGRHQGRLGALAVELPDGTSFSIGTGFSDKQRESPPPIGSLVTFRYQELSDRGVPRFPSYVGVRVEAAPTASKSKTPAAPTDDSRAGAARAKTRTTKLPASGAKPAADPPATPPAPGGKSAPRHFEFVEGKSAKFWEISRDGHDVTVCFGRIGTSGQTQTKSFGDLASAEQHLQKLVDEKTKKGYVEQAH